MADPNKLTLPLSRVKVIMKSSPEVEQVGAEPLLLITKVTELFVADLAKRAHAQQNLPVLDYKMIATLVQNDESLEFLRELVPLKITVRQFKELMAKKALQRESDSDDTDSVTSSSGSNNSRGNEAPRTDDEVITIDSN